MSVKAALETLFHDLYDTFDDADPSVGDHQNLQQQAQATIQAANQDFEQTVSQTNELNEYLNQQRRRADEADKIHVIQQDFQFGKQHRKSGLPTHPSHLKLDAQRLTQNGLLNPKAVLQQVVHERRKRSTESTSDPKWLATKSDDDMPHYMASTRSFVEHGASIPPNIVATIRGVREMRDAVRAATDKSAISNHEATLKPKRKTGDHKVSAKVREMELKKVARSQAPLAFLRNPRFQRAGEFPNRLIGAVPETICFVEYKAGHVYEMILQLRNDSHLLRRVRLLGPKTPFFEVSLISYMEDGKGEIAPGMRAEARVRFTPDSTADYTDSVTIVTENDSFEVPLKARRPPPILDIAPKVHCGNSYVGMSSSEVIQVQNIGGAGRFFVFDASSWEQGNRAPPTEGTLRVGSFQVSPTFIDVPAGGRFAMKIDYMPTQIGDTHALLLFVCDNCQTREIQLVATGCVPKVQLESVNGRGLLYEGFEGGANLQDEIDFGAVSVYNTVSAGVRLVNTAPLPLEVEWNTYLLPLDLAHVARQRGTLPRALRSDQLDTSSSADNKASESIETATQSFDETDQAFPFSIEPIAAMLGPGESADFLVKFCPQKCEVASGALMLSPVNVPQAAIIAGAAEIVVADATQDLNSDDPPGEESRHTDVEKTSNESGATQVGLRLTGLGVGKDLELNPSHLLGHAATLEQAIKLRVELRNPNGSTRSWRCAHKSDGHDDSLKLLSLSPQEGELIAGESVQVELIIMGTTPGDGRTELRFDVEPHGSPLTLPISLLVTPPRLTITALDSDGADVDFGLAPLGEVRLQTLRLSNTSGAQAPWIILPAEADTHSIGFKWSTGGCGADAREELSRVEQICAEAFNLHQLSLNAHCGVLLPHTQIDLSAVFEPRDEKALRCRLAVYVLHGDTTWINCRAEVVRRAISIEGLEKECNLDFGQCFVTVPSNSTFQLRNLTKLPTNFMFHLPSDQSVFNGDVQVTLEPSQGILEAAASCEVSASFCSTLAGEKCGMIGCLVQGGDPVGLKFAACVDGIRVSYELLDEDDARLIAPPSQVEDDHLSSTMTDTMSSPPSAIKFGDQTTIFSETSRVLLIRNHSGVHAHFDVKCELYTPPPLNFDNLTPPNVEILPYAATIVKAMGKSSRRPALSSSTRMQDDNASVAHSYRSNRSSRVARSSFTSRSRNTSTHSATELLSAEAMNTCRPRLGDEHERIQPFSSEGGVNYAARQALRRREAAILSGGCIGSGAAFNTFPSSGELEPWSKVFVKITAHSNMWGLFEDTLVVDVVGAPKLYLPMQIGVVGSPIRLNDTVVGLTFRTDPPTLNFAPVAPNAGTSKKTLRLTNHGPLPVRLESACTSDDNVFGISSDAVTLLPGVEHSLEVSFSSNAIGHSVGRLVGRPHHPFPMKLPDGGTSMDYPPLEIQLEADVVEPRIDFSERGELLFKVTSVQSSDHPRYTRTMALTNPMPMTLTFELDIAPPFVLRSVVNTMEQRDDASQTGRRTALPMKYHLPPRESILLAISFIPPRRRERDEDRKRSLDVEDTKSLFSVATSGAGSAATSVAIKKAPTTDTEAVLASRQKHTGRIRVLFEGGFEQNFGLVADICRPFLRLEPRQVDMGTIFICRSREVQVNLFNPTDAEAEWSISHANFEESEEKEDVVQGPETVDHPACFSFTPMKGIIPARGGNKPKPHPVSLRFAPEGPGEYRSQFVIKVKRGLPARLEVRASASLEEEFDDVHPIEKGLHLLLPGVI